MIYSLTLLLSPSRMILFMVDFLHNNQPRFLFLFHISLAHVSSTNYRNLLVDLCISQYVVQIDFGGPDQTRDTPDQLCPIEHKDDHQIVVCIMN